MTIYKITRKIKRIEIFSPDTPLKDWLPKQKDKPDILFNASLYTSKYQPCGTIWNNGKLINDQGKGFGFGTTTGKDILFGFPYDKKWYDYITGYYGIVQEGKAIDPAWTDKYVFNKKLTRIAFGQLSSGEFAVCVADGKTIKQFAKEGAAAGFKSLCNLDGGGSRALYWCGKWIYKSTRRPYNAVAIWLEPEEIIKVNGTMNVKCIKKCNVYNTNGALEVGRFIAVGDVCQLYTSVEKGTLQIKIIYPSGGKQRVAYIKDLTAFKII